jgi:hypothetical protein
MQAEKPETAVDAVLKLALDLPKGEQRRLHSILGMLADTGTATEPGADDGTSVNEVESVETWLGGIRAEKPWVQLQLVDDALAKVETGPAHELIKAARRELVEGHPPVAVRRAVAQMVERQPMAASLGAVGLLVAVGELGRGLFRLMF